ncbi:MAG: hypothetical protein PSU93_01745 [Methylobacter sp.]|uniref:Uncharacterized protein n=1 Tax=Candidatus Methylobacter titanis TaxID=3053457 RepID=A0AA43TH33_9GAMM|nr:hypothetical protein [Candidatus Methylobacter titanis]
MSNLDHALIEKITKARLENPLKVHSPIPKHRPVSAEELSAAIESTPAVEKPKPVYWWKTQMANKTGR